MSVVTATTTADWRAWLAANHATEREVWLVLRNKSSPVPGLSYAEAVEQALCFGWIDSLARRHDEHSRVQRFSPRKPTSGWSESNRRRVADLLERGLVAEAGRAAIEVAKERGTWGEAHG